MAYSRARRSNVGAKAPFPGLIEPALATSIEKAPNGQRWIHEIKFDGYRVQVHLANTEVKVFTRRGHDWTNRFKKIASDAWHTLDGNKWNGLYIGWRKGADLIYDGKVDHGFDAENAKAVRVHLTPLIRKTQPYGKRVAHHGIWVEPELLAEIEYRAKSAEGKVRHPFFKGLREGLWWGTTLSIDGEWVEKPADSTLTISAHFRAIMQLEQRRDRTAVNEAVQLVDPDAQRWRELPEDAWSDGLYCGGRNSPSIHRVLAGSFIGSTPSQLAHRRARKPFLSNGVVVGTDDVPQCTHRCIG
jgi:hypothetical protein